MQFFKALESIFSIIIIITIGYIMRRKKVLDEGSQRLFSKIVCNLSLPALMISNLLSSFTKASLINVKYGLLIPLISMIGCYIIGYFISIIIKVSPKRLGSFRAMFFVSNTIFIGMPVNLALFGNKATPYVLLYYIINTSFFWTIGIYGMSKDGQVGSKEKPDIKESLKRIFSPPLLGFILAVLLILCQIRLPLFIMDTCKYLGGLTTPLSMLFIGAAISEVEFKDVKPSIDMFIIIIGRFIVSPLSIILLGTFIKVPSLMLKVFIIQAAMPVMTQTSITAKAYGGDEKYAAVMTAVTTVLAMVVIPIYMGLI